jgi:MarR family transcriptional repressor of emrRAB
MTHAYNICMVDTRTANLLGALALALSDDMSKMGEQLSGQGAGPVAALNLIGTYPGQSIDSLSRTLQLSHSGAVRLVDRLVERGLVEKLPGPDRRSVSLSLTGDGEQEVQSVFQERRSRLQQALEVLSDPEQAQLQAMLKKMLAHIGQGRTTCRLCEVFICREKGCPVPDKELVKAGGSENERENPK